MKLTLVFFWPNCHTGTDEFLFWDGHFVYGSWKTVPMNVDEVLGLVDIFKWEYLGHL